MIQLLFLDQVPLYPVDVDTLTNLQNILCEWSIFDEDLPGVRHEESSEKGSDHIDHCTIEDDDVA